MANQRARQLRQNRTPAEVRLWKELRLLKKHGCKFRQQAPIDHYIVDFVCLSQRLVIEVDGGTHGTDAERKYDVLREAYLAEQGFRVVRFWNEDVMRNLAGVMDSIAEMLDTSGSLTPTPDPSPQGGGEKKTR